MTARSNSSPSRLLLVDDDPNNRDMLSRRLARQGYAVDVAEDGPRALEILKQAEYDLVLLDQMMPGMSGIDLLHLLRATYSPSELPVIMVTAVDQSQVVVEALNHGANDYIVKPVDMPVITARIEAQLSRAKEEKQLKRVDALTGLCNRPVLLERMAAAVERVRRDTEKNPAILLLDLDGFKVVNDSFGHETGDQLLIEVANRMRAVAGEMNLTDRATLARVGGDEFVILLDQAQSTQHLRDLGDAILNRVSRPVTLRALPVSISGSLGIAPGSPDEPSPEGWLGNADLAMYRAKETGKNRWEIFDPSLRQRAQARMSIAIDLRTAVERKELVAYYQPKYQLENRAILGFEALMRWRHPEHGLMSPPDFIPVAEETGLIVPMGTWILNIACRQLKAWQSKFPFPVPLSMNVNLSVKQLKDPGLVAHVKELLEETGIAPGTLKLELTESCLMTEIESAEEVLSDLKSLQVGLKLDDFGTGYSSLSYLRAIHFDSLKIDRSFVKRLSSDSESSAIVETIVKLAHALHMNVVAEGIETEGQLNELIDIGCEAGQGFYFSAPVDAAAAEKLLEKQAAAS